MREREMGRPFISEVHCANGLLQKVVVQHVAKPHNRDKGQVAMNLITHTLTTRIET